VICGTLGLGYILCACIGILTETLKYNPGLRLPLLAECGRTVHGATANVLFKTVVLPDDDENFVRASRGGLGKIDSAALGPASALLRNVARYAPRIRTLVVVDPAYAVSKHENTLFELEAHEDAEEEEEAGTTPVSGAHVRALLEKCEALEELVWASSVPPPDGICEASLHFIWPGFNSDSGYTGTLRTHAQPQTVHVRT
jgi:hypothetical protein